MTSSAHHSITETEPVRSSLPRVVFASLVGTTIEWYDFFLYGAAAALVFNTIFFPNSDPLVGTLLAFGTYALGFAARPIGGVVFGHFGDRIGRKKLLMLSLIMMGVATFCIGLLPTYGQVGVAGADPAGAAAPDPGLRGRRRVGRRRAAGGRVRHPGEARFLGELAPGRGPGRQPAGRGGAGGADRGAERGRLPGVGLAHPVPALRGAGRHRVLDPPGGGRDPGFPGGAAAGGGKAGAA